LDRVRVTPDLNTVYVPLDRDQLEDAPTFSRGDFDEMNDRDWQKRNKEFYSKAD